MISISNNHPTIPHMRTASGQTPESRGVRLSAKCWRYWFVDANVVYNMYCKAIVWINMQTGQKWLKQRCNTFVNPLLQDSGRTSVAIEGPLKHCNGGLTKVLQWRLASCQGVSLASLPWNTSVNPPLQFFCPTSVAILAGPESCNRGLTKILQCGFGHFRHRGWHRGFD